MIKKGWKMAEKMFQPVFGCCKHPQAGWNTQQTDFCKKKVGHCKEYNC